MTNYREEKFRTVDAPLEHPIWPLNGVVIFPWEQVPKWLRQYSTHGGDEDGAIWVPVSIQNNPGEYPFFLERIWDMYGTEQDFVQFENGLLIIWAHS
jgi:hypothetical protein